MAKENKTAKLGSERIADQIAEIDQLIAQLHQDRCASESLATECVVSDEEKYLEACSEAGRSQGRIDGLTDRKRRLESHREKALREERIKKIESMRAEFMAAREARDSFANEVKRLKAPIQKQYEIDIAKVDLRYQELNAEQNRLESELSTLEVEELELQLRDPDVENRDVIQGHMEMLRNTAADRRSHLVQARGHIVHLTKFINGEPVQRPASI